MDNSDGEEMNIEELASNLTTYREQLQQVRKLLIDDPRNSEYVDMEKELVEVIALTEELLMTAKQSNADPGLHSGKSIAEDTDKFPIGSKVQAVYSEDGEWYEATVHAHTPIGYYVCYNGWGNKEEVDADNVRAIEEGSANPLLEAEKVAVATKEALKRKIAQAATTDETQAWSLPPKLQIDPNDPEDVKIAKRKKIHAFKSKMRMEAKEVSQNKRQNAWQQFQTTKGKAKKVGYFTGRKRESIFKSPEDTFGKVGVTGSGKGLTDFQKREKHLHLKGSNLETSDD